MIWYDDANDLSHGLAYATQDAYFSPKAKLVFHHARISQATADEYFASKAINPANLLPSYLSDALLDSARPQRMTHRSDVSPAMLANPRLAWRNSDWLTCRGVLRVPLPSSVQAELTKLRPKNTDKYWHLNEKLPEYLRNQIGTNNVLYGGSFWQPDVKQQSKDRPKVYPTIYDGNLDRLTEGTFSDGSYHKESVIVQDYLGFMDCGRKALAPIEAVITGRQVESWNISQETCFINGILIGEYKRCRDYIPIAYEENDYAIFESQEIRAENG